MQYLKTNTATRVTVGPFFDKTDGVTPETSLTVTSCKLTMSVDTGGVPTLVLDANATASGGSNDMVHITGDDAGFYDLELAAANVNYLGRARLAITDAATHCPVFHEFMIVPADVYDIMTGVSPVGTAQTGDAYAVVNSGTYGNAALKTQVAAIETDTQDIQTRIPAALTSNGNMKSSVLEFISTTFTEGATGRIADAFKQFFNIASPTSTINTITTVTNLTNAPTAGDLTATMKASVTTAATSSTPSVTVSDKTGFKLASDGMNSVAGYTP